MKPDLDVEAPPQAFNFAQHLISLNKAHPHKVAFVDDQTELTYGELALQIQGCAAALMAGGVRREERVLVLMHDCIAWPISFLGALYAGVVPVAVNTLLTAQDYAYMLQHCRAQMVLASAALLPQLEAALLSTQHEVKQVVVAAPTGILPTQLAGVACLGMTAWLDAQAHRLDNTAATMVDADEPAFWLYSSGSTGRPKGTVHTHANLYWTAELYGRRILGLHGGDKVFSAAKLFFAYGLGNALSFPLSVGATVLLMAERPTPDAVFKRWLEHQPTVFFGAPTGFAGMLASPNLPAPNRVSLRLASSAGEALPADIGQRFTAHFGVEIIDGIGSTEMLHIFLSNRPGKVRYGTTGWPVPGYELELRDEAGGSVPQGDVGDLFIKGPSAALMYWANREKSSETFQGVWTKSGDKYLCNEDGSFTYCGRSDDMLKVSGVYVSPFEVEATLVQHESVLEAAVIGVPDEQGLIKSKAYVVLKAGQQTDEATLQAFVKDRLAPFKYPRSIVFINELPKTATGKIQRYKLREAAASGS